MPDQPQFIRTLRVRVKDRHAPVLRRMAAEVNTVWNEINRHQIEVYRREGRLLSGFDFHSFTVGAAREFDLIRSMTIQEISQQYAVRRRVAKRSRLRWRKTYGRRRNLGWVPFKSQDVKWRNGRAIFAGHSFRVWDSYLMSQYTLRGGCFAEDACGHWYLCIFVSTTATPHSGGDPIGIDLGLKEIAVCSDGRRLKNPRWYRRVQEKIGIAQRAKQRKRAARLYRKTRRQRRDTLHKFSREVVDRASAIYIGDVKSSAIGKSKLAKSTYDASWGILKAMLRYKGQQAGIEVREVSERFSTQVCSCCGVLPHSSPRGRADLGIREWTCSDCGAIHDRDINAALNILTVGHGRPAEGIPVKGGCQAAVVATKPHRHADSKSASSVAPLVRRVN